MKILLLADSRSYHTERYVKQMQKAGCEILLASIERGQVDHNSLRSMSYLPSTFSYAFAKDSVEKIIKKFQPHIVNAHIASGYGYLMSRLSTKQPRVLHLFGSDILVVPKKSYLRKQKVIRALRKADVVVADSAFLLREAEALVKLQSTAVIPWGIERELLDLHKRDYSIGKPLKVIVPRMHEAVYQNELILTALSGLVNDNRIQLTFSTQGSLYESFRQYASSLCDDRVKYYQPMERSDYMQFVSGFDVYISASRSDSSPVSLIEAMGVGLIPVVAQIDGLDEWVSAKNSYNFKHDNPEKLTQIITNLCDTGNRHEGMRIGNRQMVEERAIFEENMQLQIQTMQKVLA